MLVACTLLLFGSGLVIWYQYFAWGLPVWARRLGAVAHAIAAFVMIEGIIVHIYASIRVQGSNRVMIRGTASPAWVRHHHPGWYRKIAKQRGLTG